MCACARVRLRSLIPFWGDNSEESSCYQSEKEAHLFLDHETEQCWLNPPCVSWMFMTSLAVSVGKKWIYLERYTFHRQNEVHLKRREQPGRNTFHGVGHLRSLGPNLASPCTVGPVPSSSGGRTSCHIVPTETPEHSFVKGFRGSLNTATRIRSLGHRGLFPSLWPQHPTLHSSHGDSGAASAGT
ncbi:uncharacterized protein LOC133093845 isoform X2 [Eubalaena glacialis]|uniref:uncharacterized protein LOC133093845 isoform X2 n=1 Tax=Eubalaena glacialis TaxID=27606 RepID=UPI002A59ED49|nr:uncharacterized protein LOC133093845 isoform X2 [Eubalaena glacialis]